MTITEARKLAKRQLDYGWYQGTSATEVYVFCPNCRQGVRTTVLAWATVSQRVTALKDVLTDHLTDCEGTPS